MHVMHYISHVPLKITRVLLYAINLYVVKHTTLITMHSVLNGHDRVHVYDFLERILINFHLKNSSYIPVYMCMGV